MFEPLVDQWELTEPVGSCAAEQSSGKSVPNGTFEHHLSSQNLIALPFFTSITIAKKKMSFTVLISFQKGDEDAPFMHLFDQHPVLGCSCVKQVMPISARVLK